MKGFLEDEYHRECDYHDTIDSQRTVLVHWNDDENILTSRGVKSGSVVNIEAHQNAISDKLSMLSLGS
jgi:hypothetical protein